MEKLKRLTVMSANATWPSQIFRSAPFMLQVSFPSKSCKMGLPFATPEPAFALFIFPLEATEETLIFFIGLSFSTTAFSLPRDFRGDASPPTMSSSFPATRERTEASASAPLFEGVEHTSKTRAWAVCACAGNGRIHPCSCIRLKNCASNGSPCSVFLDPKMISLLLARVKETFILRQSLTRSPI